MSRVKFFPSSTLIFGNTDDGKPLFWDLLDPGVRSVLVVAEDPHALMAPWLSEMYAASHIDANLTLLHGDEKYDLPVPQYSQYDRSAGKAVMRVSADAEAVSTGRRKVGDLEFHMVVIDDIAKFLAHQDFQERETLRYLMVHEDTIQVNVLAGMSIYDYDYDLAGQFGAVLTFNGQVGVFKDVKFRTV